jgi:Flp pilus assembly pilin Flp
MKKNSTPSVRNFVRDTRGANMVEYIILVGLVALICIGGYKIFGEKVNTAVHQQSDTVGGDINTKPGS